MDASLRDKYITRFQERFRKRYGLNLSQEKAEEKFGKLVRLARLVRDHRAARQKLKSEDDRT